VKKRFQIYQILIVLVLIPIFYQDSIRNYFLIPFIKWILPTGFVNISDNNYFVPAWLSILIVQVFTVIIISIFLRVDNLGFSDIGYNNDFKRTLNFIIGLIFIGFIFYFIKTQFGISLNGLINNSQVKPILCSKGELIFWIFYVPFSCICEEIIFRGFGINSFKSLGFNILLCVILPMISWFSIHNLDSFGGIIRGIIFLGLNSILFSGLYLWRRNLNFSIALHSIGNLMIILI